MPPPVRPVAVPLASQCPSPHPKHTLAQEAGATRVVTAETEAGLAVGGLVARELGVASRAVASLSDVLRRDMDARSHEMAEEMHAPGAAGASAPGGGESAATGVFKFDQTRSPTVADDAIESDAQQQQQPGGREGGRGEGGEGGRGAGT